MDELRASVEQAFAAFLQRSILFQPGETTSGDPMVGIGCCAPEARASGGTWTRSIHGPRFTFRPHHQAPSGGKQRALAGIEGLVPETLHAAHPRPTARENQR